MNKPCKLSFLPQLIVAASLLAACGRGTPQTTGQPTAARTVAPAGATSSEPTPDWTPTPSGPRGVVSIWHSFNEREFSILEEAMASFQKVYPDLLFDVTYVPLEDLFTRFQQAAQISGGPGLIFGPASWGPPLWEAGLLADPTLGVDADLLQALNPAGVAAAQVRGAQAGLPYSLEGVVLYRNAFLVPEAPATLEGLVSLAQSVTRGEVIGAVLERSFFYSGGHLTGIGGEWIDSNGAPNFNNERGIAWIELLRQLEKAGPAEMLSDRDLDLFKSGKVGFLIDATWNRETLAEALGAGNLAIDPWPDAPGGSLSGFVQANNAYLSAKTSPGNAEAALLFLQYFLSQENQAALAGIGRIPARTDLELNDRLMMEAMDALAGGAPYPAHPQAEIYPGIVDSALRRVFDEGAAPAEALQSAEDTILNTGQVGPPVATP